MITQDGCKRELQPYGLSGGNIKCRSLVYGRSRPKHAVSKRLMALAEDKRPEANWVIELGLYALQCHSDVS